MYNLFLFKNKDRLKIESGQIDIRVIFFFFLIVIISAFVGFNIAKFSPLLPIGILAALAIGITTLVNTNFGLTILIFSMLLSPEMSLAATPERAVILRIDDLLIIAVFFVWLAKIAIRKELSLLRKSPINKPIFAYLSINIFSTTLGALTGDVKPVVGFFYILKYIEYFMVFFLFLNNLNNLKQIKRFIFFFLLVSLIIGGIAYTQIGTLPRPTAPFEGEHAEPNTLAGYLVITFAVALGILLYAKSPFVKLILGGLIFFNIYPFLMTLSRSGYLGFITLYSIFLIFSKRHKLSLVLILLAAILIAPVIVPEKVVDRIFHTFTGGSAVTFGGEELTLEKSAAARVESWAYAFRSLQEKALFGFGVTGRGFMDSQYARFLSETGIVGFLIGLWLISSVLINTFRIYKNSEDEYAKGLSLSFLSAFSAIMIIGFTTNVFVIVRISEPLWFLCACVMSLPAIQNISLPSQRPLSLTSKGGA
ncbi:MAG: O-antigen ligase family protein [Candidatus Omnitrophica bacterium]|nr:O-antigen ligase family protein [Candidatus Omnitrophota bacterium]